MSSNCCINTSLTTLHFTTYFICKLGAFCRSSQITCAILCFFDGVKTCLLNSICMLIEIHIPEHHNTRQQQGSWVCFILACYIRSCAMNLHKTNIAGRCKIYGLSFTKFWNTILNLSIRGEVSFMPQACRALGKIPQHPTKWRLGLSQTQYRCFGEEKNPLALPGINCWLSSP